MSTAVVQQSTPIPASFMPIGLQHHLTPTPTPTLVPLPSKPAFQQQKTVVPPMPEPPAVITEMRKGAVYRQFKTGKLLGKVTSIISFYSFFVYLFQGGFARCYEVTKVDQSNEKLACKVIPKSNLVRSRQKQKLISEIKLHKAMNHPQIVKFYTFFEDSENVYLIMELCNNAVSCYLLVNFKF